METHYIVFIAIFIILFTYYIKCKREKRKKERIENERKKSEMFLIKKIIASGVKLQIEEDLDEFDENDQDHSSRKKNTFFLTI